MSENDLLKTRLEGLVKATISHVTGSGAAAPADLANQVVFTVGKTILEEGILANLFPFPNYFNMILSNKHGF